MEIFHALVKTTIALFIIIDPIGLIPIFVALTTGQTDQQRTSLLSKAVVVAFLLLIVFSLAGRWILGLFGITLSDFKIAGGILLLMIALHTVSYAHTEESTNGPAGIVPLAVPLLAGPGAMTSTIVFINLYGLWITIGAIGITFLIAFIIYRFVGPIYRLIGETGADVVAKIAGMLLAALAILFIRQGIQEIFHL